MKTQPDYSTRLVTKTTQLTVFAGDVLESLRDGQKYKLDSRKGDRLRVVRLGAKASQIKDAKEFGLIEVSNERK